MFFAVKNTCSTESLESLVCMFYITDVISQVSDCGSDSYRKVGCEWKIPGISSTFPFASDMCYIGCLNCTWNVPDSLSIICMF